MIWVLIKDQKKTKTKNNTFQIPGDYYFKLKNTILNMKIFKILYKSTYEEYIGIFSEFAIYLCGIERFFTEFWLSVILPVTHSLSGCSIKDVL
jgi:hypothetical protein